MKPQPFVVNVKYTHRSNKTFIKQASSLTRSNWESRFPFNFLLLTDSC